MNIRNITLTLCLVFSSIAMYGATSIVEVARQFYKNQIDVDSLFNYMKNDSHGGEAYWWALHSSEKNDPMANYILGRCYLAGIGTSEDMPKAIEYFEKAISQGVDEAAVDLGRMYLYGWGVEKDLTKANQLFNQAANRNRPRGIYMLGRIYLDKEDYQKAFPLMKKAADAGYSGACVDAGWMYEKGFGVESDQTKAFEYYLKAAQKGNDVGLSNAGGCYENGIGVEQDQEKALQYYRSAADKGNARGAYKIGRFYELGDPRDGHSQEKALKWYKISADKGFEPAIVELAVRMYDGLGVEEDKQKAVEMLEAVEEDNIGPWAACLIADYYLTLDPVKALKWAQLAYDIADEYGSTVISCKLLGMIYLNGGKKVYNRDLALKYLREGAELDNPECIELLKSLGVPFVDPDQGVSSGVREW